MFDVARLAVMFYIEFLLLPGSVFSAISAPHGP